MTSCLTTFADKMKAARTVIITLLTTSTSHHYVAYRLIWDAQNHFKTCEMAAIVRPQFVAFFEYIGFHSAGVQTATGLLMHLGHDCFPQCVSLTRVLDVYKVQDRSIQEYDPISNHRLTDVVESSGRQLIERNKSVRQRCRHRHDSTRH